MSRWMLLACALLASAFSVQGARNLASTEGNTTSSSSDVRPKISGSWVRDWTVRLDIITRGPGCANFRGAPRRAYIRAASQLSGVPRRSIRAKCRARTNDLVITVLVTKTQTLNQAEQMEDMLDRAIDTTMPGLVAQFGGASYIPLDDLCTGVVGYEGGCS